MTDRAGVERSLRQALSALRQLLADVGRHLEDALKPLEPFIGRGFVRALILDSCGELDELAACCSAGGLYVEDLTVTASVGLEVEGFLNREGNAAVAPPADRISAAVSSP